MTAEEIINIIEEEYMSCPNIIGLNGRLFCYTWWRHDDCLRLMHLLNTITNDIKYTVPNIKQEVYESVEKMMNDPKTYEILRKLGSDYNKDGKPYWEQ